MIYTKTEYTPNDDNNKITNWLGKKIQWLDYISSKYLWETEDRIAEFFFRAYVSSGSWGP